MDPFSVPREEKDPGGVPTIDAGQSPAKDGLSIRQPPFPGKILDNVGHTVR